MLESSGDSSVGNVEGRRAGVAGGHLSEQTPGVEVHLGANSPSGRDSLPDTERLVLNSRIDRSLKTT